MRILVATDSIGALSSARAGAALAEVWPPGTAQVVPVGVAGGGFVQSMDDQLGVPCLTSATGVAVTSRARGAGTAVLLVETARPAAAGLPLDESSAPLGTALVELLGEGPVDRVYLDLAGADVHDGGAGLLAALGASADVAL